MLAPVLSACVAALVVVPVVASRAQSVPPTQPISDLSVRTPISQQFDYDDNQGLNTLEEKPSYTSVTSPELIINSDTPTAHLGLDTLANIRVSNQAVYSSNDIHSTATGLYKGQTWSIGGSAGIDYDKTTTSEETTSGNTEVNSRHTGYNVAPQISYSPSVRDLFQLSGSFAASTYENTSIFTNYEYYGITPSYSRAVDLQNRAVISFPISRYQTTTGPSSANDNYGALIGWQNAYSQNINLSGDVGFLQIEQYQSGGGQSHASSFNVSFDLAAAVHTLQDDISVSASRVPTPQSGGLQALTTSFSVSDTHHITQRLQAGLAATYHFSDYTGTPSSSQNVQKSYLSVTPKILYHLTETTEVDLSYKYRQKDSENLPSTAGSGNELAVSNAVILNFSFSPYPESWK